MKKLVTIIAVVQVFTFAVPFAASVNTPVAGADAPEAYAECGVNEAMAYALAVVGELAGSTAAVDPIWLYENTETSPDGSASSSVASGIGYGIASASTTGGQFASCDASPIWPGDRLPDPNEINVPTSVEWGFETDRDELPTFGCLVDGASDRTVHFSGGLLADAEGKRWFTGVASASDTTTNITIEVEERLIFRSSTEGDAEAQGTPIGVLIEAGFAPGMCEVDLRVS